MSSVSGPNYTYRTEETTADNYIKARQSGQPRLQLAIALMGLVSLGYMLWTIAKMLGLLEGRFS